MSLITDRIVPWTMMGRETQERDKVDNVLKGVGMDWTVESRQVLIPNPDTQHLADAGRFRANVRSSDGYVMGIVSDKYEIVQNCEAFSFLDYMIPEGLIIDRGGIINNKKVWLSGKLQPFDVGGEQIDNYVLFTNSHDGKGSVKICMTPVRVLCQNTLSLAFRHSYRSWSVAHVSGTREKLQEVEKMMVRVYQYMDEFKDTATILQNKHVSDSELRSILERLFVLERDPSDQRKRFVMENRATVTNIFKNAPDLGRGTAWDLINAVSDFATHYTQDYNEGAYRSSVVSKIINGHPLIDTAFTLVAA